MSPTAQRIAIAKACPYLVEWHDDKPYWRGAWSSVGEGNEHFAIFDPLNDLNAMHDAEEVLLNTDRYDRYKWEIAKLIYPDCDLDISMISTDVVRATAAQRAEAFLRTLNLWDDTK